MVTVECNGESFKIRNNVAKTLEENGYIVKDRANSLLYHPAADHTMTGIRFYAAALHEDTDSMASGASFNGFLDHEKSLCGKV